MALLLAADLFVALEEHIPGRDWEALSRRLGKSGRAFKRQVARTHPNPSADILFHALRKLGLSLGGAQCLSGLRGCIAEERKRRSLSVRDLARRSGLTKKCVCAVLRGQQIPRLRTLMALCDAAGVGLVLAPVEK